jgi:hypothetical protein
MFFAANILILLVSNSLFNTAYERFDQLICVNWAFRKDGNMGVCRCIAIIVSISAALFFPCLLEAGVNATAWVSLTVPSKEGRPGVPTIVSIGISGATSVHSFSIKVAYDPSVVKFDGAQKSLSIGTPSFLELKGGEIAGFLAVPQQACVEIAATQAGTNRSVTASGSGVAAYCKFTTLTSGNPGIRIVEAVLVNESGVVDTVIGKGALPRQ